MFERILDAVDGSRATAVAQTLLAHRFPMALTGGLAIEAQLRAHGRPSERRALNDVDVVVDSFAAIPCTVANDFLPHHVHPFAAEGKTLLQLVDPARALRVDLFRPFGRTLARSCRLGDDTDPLDVVSVEDLVARTTAQVCSALRRRRPLATKHARAFSRLAGLGRPVRLDEAWADHRQDLAMSFGAAFREASQLMDACPELIVEERYSAVVTTCDRCCASGALRPSDPRAIVRVLGYW